ncbi:T9SS type A sorting domain-containing protein [Chryseobacterium culicis]|uniref:Uncharacterized protein n=1 Tax=Chryseobacterium culicis TaxID=680127 RepID=A0A2S9CHZ3_CHRCI|nr:T9SS type A sorting domain-containing protein [Chryseobacterium culicis]PRB80093.1 hypothetical protein CQ022_22375 [Chryseobacterium culicis]PRB87339.1 hypothetical protein CQ033_22360 [Chryseobacterium culicis]
MKKILLLCLLTVSIVLSAQIKLGAGSTDTGNAPVNTDYSTSYSQQIFTKQEINADTAGNITGLKFYVTSSANPYYQSNWDVYIGHTTKATFAANDNWIQSGQMVKVYSGNIKNVNGIIDITFTTPFTYDNVQNLVIAVHGMLSNDNPSNQFFVYNTTEGGARYLLDPGFGDPSTSYQGNVLPYKSVITLKGLVSSVLPVCPAVSYPADNAILVPVSPAIIWAASPEATGYKVSIGTTPGGTDVLNEQWVAATSFTPPTPLLYNTTYYLKVTAIGSAGESSGCFNRKFKTTPLPPSNDECVNAINLAVNPSMDCTNITSGTTLLATSSVAPASCNTSYSHNDVWYKFTATNSRHMIKLSNIVSVGTVNTTYLYAQVFKGDCNNLTSHLCFNDANGSLGYTFAEGLTVGETYYVKVYSLAGNGNAQNFNICIGVPPPSPSNDHCTGAIDLPVNPNMTCSVVTLGTTSWATKTPMSICNTNSEYDVWYKFTATATKHMVRITDISSVGPTYSVNTEFRVFGGSCDNLICKGGGANTNLIIGLTVGETYYVRVYQPNGNVGNAINFKICIGTDSALPPLNDECDNAIVLTVNPDLNCSVVTMGQTAGATASGGAGVPCTGNPDDDVWFKFVATSTSHRISLINIVPTGAFYADSLINFQVFKGTCGNLTNFKCSYPTMSNITGFTVGETYYVRVYSYGGPESNQNFNICVGTIPPPVNDDCSGALMASVFPYTYTQTDAQNTTNNDGFVTVCSDGMNNGTWFTFIGNGTKHTITVSMPTGSSFNPQIGLFGGSCGNLTCVKTVDSFFGGYTETLSYDTVAGTVYYVNVGNQHNSIDNMEDVFTITIQREGDVSLNTSEASNRKEDIDVYPNPFKEVLNISKADKVKSVSILDSSGRLIKTIDTPSSSLHLGDLKQGVYLVVLNMKDGSKQTVKAIKR